jgi:hypothetical protein
VPTVRVDVTEADIREGTPSDTQRCAIARAFERAAGCACLVARGHLYPGGGRQRVALPEAARDFQRRYDGPGGRWQALPFSFGVDVPEVSARA